MYQTGLSTENGEKQLKCDRPQLDIRLSLITLLEILTVGVV